MLSVGLVHESPRWLDKNLLKLKVGVYGFLTRIAWTRKSLFPSASERQYSRQLWSRNAVACAADDLELFNDVGVPSGLSYSDYSPSEATSGSFSHPFKMDDSSEKPTMDSLESFIGFAEPDFRATRLDFDAMASRTSPHEDRRSKVKQSRKRRFNATNDAATSDNSFSTPSSISMSLYSGADAHGSANEDQLSLVHDETKTLHNRQRSHDQSSLTEVDQLFNDWVKDYPKAQFGASFSKGIGAINIAGPKGRGYRPTASSEVPLAAYPGVPSITESDSSAPSLSSSFSSVPSLSPHLVYPYQQDSLAGINSSRSNTSISEVESHAYAVQMFENLHFRNQNEDFVNEQALLPSHKPIGPSMPYGVSSVGNRFKFENQFQDYMSPEVMSKKAKLNDVARFECKYCNAKFKVKGYLTRHLKKHSASKAFKCPFYTEPKNATNVTKCHPSGGFSRRDTYKTHLKALHFIYPPGTRSAERSYTNGRCAGCFQYFENNAVWLETHIETGACSGAVEN
ncbi:Piso0_001676 [Millerozyma farinosa CBS 7064]|uniref:Piso0_001676 protein n=1 Tax=Pichia sorbitophila (strain ATCC MYA-4447 / BCRC 22081 / CBS 7064 / NBRC 10061 / NRRL Y-12695) TaxID=559304 RepID=G8YNT1_PICSO|nr:Piso0_001676 [Millerozyma farinosa CBS 7064]